MRIGVGTAEVFEDGGAAEPPRPTHLAGGQAPLAGFPLDGVAGNAQPLGALLRAQKLLRVLQ